MPEVDTALNSQGRTMVDPAKQRQVGEEVRKEQIEVEGDQDRLHHDQRQSIRSGDRGRWSYGSLAHPR